METKTKILDTKITLSPGVTIELTPLQERFLVKIFDEGEVDIWKGKEVALEDILDGDTLTKLLMARTLYLVTDPIAYLTNPNEEHRINELSLMLVVYKHTLYLLDKVSNRD